MTPALFAPERRWRGAGLIVLGLMEAALLAGAALALKGAIEGDGAFSLALAGGLALAGACLAWARPVAAEAFGMDYANALRLFLARHAVARAGGGRLGAMAVRMTGDLNALKDWATTGLSDTVAALAALTAGACVLWFSLGAKGAVIGAVAAAPCLVFAAAAAPFLFRSHQRLRQERGRVSALAGDIVLGAAALAHYQAGRREERRLAARSQRLRYVSVQRRQLAALIAAPAVAAGTLGALTAAFYAASGQSASLTGGDWAAVMIGLGFIATGLGGLARGLDALAAFRAGAVRMRALGKELTAAEHGASPAGQEHAPQPAPSGVRFVELADPARACAAVIAEHEAAAGQAQLDGLSARAAARKVGLAAPTTPLLRASVRRNLSLARPALSDAAAIAALEAAGLDPQAFPLDRLVDPRDPDLDEWQAARLRLARALAHGPKALFVAEPALLSAPDYADLMRRAHAQAGALVVAPSPARLRVE